MKLFDQSRRDIPPTEPQPRRLSPQRETMIATRWTYWKPLCLVAIRQNNQPDTILLELKRTHRAAILLCWDWHIPWSEITAQALDNPLTSEETRLNLIKTIQWRATNAAYFAKFKDRSSHAYRERNRPQPPLVGE